MTDEELVAKLVAELQYGPPMAEQMVKTFRICFENMEVVKVATEAAPVAMHLLTSEDPELQARIDALAREQVEITKAVIEEKEQGGGKP